MTPDPTPNPVVLEEPLDEDFVEPNNGLEPVGDAEPFVAPEEAPRNDEVPE